MATADSILNPLLAELHDGTLEPGTRIAPERVLADRFGASRVSVREALARLAHWRVLEVRQGSGAVVAPREAWSLGVLSAALTAAESPLPPLLRDAAVGALALRRGMLRLALPLASLRLDADDDGLSNARRSVEEAWQRRAEPVAFVRADARALQLAFAAARAWPAAWLGGDLTALAVALAGRRSHPLPVDPGYRDGMLALLDALATSRDAAAERLLSSHLARLDRALLDVP